MAISQNFPNISPTLNLNFTRSKKLDPRISFTRSSSATRTNSQGIIEVVSSNIPRFDHSYISSTGTTQSLGLLIEESRTNLFPWSETFTSGNGWGGAGTINLDSSIVDPRGNTGTVYYPTVSEWTRAFDGVGITTISLSFFTKVRVGGSGNLTRIQIYQETAIGEPSNVGLYDFDMVGSNPDSGRFANIVRKVYPNGWYRFSCKVSANTGIGSGNFTSTSRVDLEGGSTTNYVWGIQVENGSFSTSYIPTSGSSVTRSGDLAFVDFPANNWYNYSEGSLIFQYSSVPYEAGASAGFPAIGFAQTDGSSTSSNQFFFLKSTGSSQYLVRDNGVDQVGLTDFTGTSASKVGFAYTSNLFVLARNGSIVGSDTAGTVPRSVGTLLLGTNSKTVSNNMNACISNVIYYPKALTSSQLQNLTE